MRAEFKRASVALGGASVMGLVIGLPGGPPSMVMHLLSLPGIMLGLSVVMLPPLYIATTTLGSAPPADRFVEAGTSAMRDTGIVLLGLAAPLLFLIATSSLWATVWLLGNLALGLGALIGVRSLWYSLFEQAPRRPMVLYLTWVAVGFSIAAHLSMAAFLKE